MLTYYVFKHILGIQTLHPSNSSAREGSSKCISITQNIYLGAADPNLKPDLEYHLSSSWEISMTKKLHKLDHNGKRGTETYSIWYVT